MRAPRPSTFGLSHACSCHLLEHMRSRALTKPAVSPTTVSERSMPFPLDKNVCPRRGSYPCYDVHADDMFTQIVLMSPAPIAVGPSLDKQVPE